VKIPYRLVAVAAVATGYYIYDKSKRVVKILSKKESDRLAQSESIEVEYSEVKKEEPAKDKQAK
jgi:hypothetical protein